LTGARKFSSILIWSVISAAFIGPGTLTTAIAAGSLYKLDLIWAVILSGIACFMLLELAGRISIATNKSMGTLLLQRFGKSKGKTISIVLGIAVIFGCAAYEAGNIMGAVSGLQLLSGLKPKLLTLIITILACIVLWSGKRKLIALIMTALVMLMGFAFCWLAIKNFPDANSFISAFRNIHIPKEAQLITVGLIGTTIVPYNLFIGAGISKGQDLFTMRTGLVLSVFIGTLITLSILIAGNVVDDFSSFADLQFALESHLGIAAGILLGLGLLAAGFSSAVTSPYAASIVAEDVLNIKSKSKIKLVWGLVLLSGLLFGMSDYRPIPVIIAAQAINGLILPLVAVYLIILSNDRSLINSKHAHPFAYNILLLLVLAIVMLIGLHNIDKSLAQVFNMESGNWLIIFLVTTLVLLLVIWQLIKKRKFSQVNFL